jgi:hypothetical protein
MFTTFSVMRIGKWSRSRDSAVGIATGYRLGDQGIGVLAPVGAGIFTSSPSLHLF